MPRSFTGIKTGTLYAKSAQCQNLEIKYFDKTL